MRDRDATGRPRNDRPRDALGRPLEYGQKGVEPLPEDLDTSPDAIVGLTTQLLDEGRPFQAHEVLEAAWKGSADPARVAWKGMAQLAVALTHSMRGNATGAARLRQRGLVNLAAGELPLVAHPLRDRLLDLTREHRH